MFVGEFLISRFFHWVANLVVFIIIIKRKWFWRWIRAKMLKSGKEIEWNEEQQIFSRLNVRNEPIPNLNLYFLLLLYRFCLFFFDPFWLFSWSSYLCGWCLVKASHIRINSISINFFLFLFCLWWKWGSAQPIFGNSVNVSRMKMRYCKLRCCAGIAKYRLNGQRNQGSRWRRRS